MKWKIVASPTKGQSNERLEAAILSRAQCFAVVCPVRAGADRGAGTVFQSCTENHRDAERIHGFSDSALRPQDPFAVHAADVWRFLTSYELVVAHNAAFDLRFINREM